VCVVLVTMLSVSLRSLPREVLALSVCLAAYPTVSTVFYCPVASSCCKYIIAYSDEFVKYQDDLFVKNI